jgi:hypothetical protein
MSKGYEHSARGSVVIALAVEAATVELTTTTDNPGSLNGHRPLRIAGRSAMSASVTETPTRQLTITDRCDRCSAQAYAKTRSPEGRELLWCGHHFKFHEAALAEKAHVVEADERELINAMPVPSANVD